MKTIINIKTLETVLFNEHDLPILVHGKDRSGASLLSITISALLHSKRFKLCIFTAFPMAKEEFMSQINTPEEVFYLEEEKDFEKANTYQTVIIQSGNIELFLSFISLLESKDRMLFIKNIETINIECFDKVKSFKFIVSGDLELNPLQSHFKTASYNTEILFSALEGRTLPNLEKYQSLMKNKSEEKVISIAQ